jgi:hypothetical protein
MILVAAQVKKKKIRIASYREYNKKYQPSIIQIQEHPKK